MGDTPRRFVRALGSEEREALARLRRERPRTLALRAEAVLLSASGLSVPEIMRRLGASRPTVTGWLSRFERAGVPGLLTRPRSGRPPKLTDRVLRHLATAAGARPGEVGVDLAAWTLPALRDYLVRAGVVPAISLESLRGALRRTGLSLRTVRTRLTQKGTTTMIPASFEYHAPGSIGEATALLARLGEDAKVLSGGQSLIPLMKLRLASPQHVVDINGIQGLDGIREG
ncbi:MAG TPA: helix-turn-helix domain-containing protein, partial [Methylomirabilota bacterium]|nr:helix-turn-helix domain-containing protein [Methylomirabilota bacterium]